ncbi:unnamed protein product [Bursaphelenchus xylophilus]|nr:unnamed protein product [Bursaphelenchus xylophilus]CAG9122209.1 unnamed protein product [Bursaphelenchus xylophilus]
MTSYLWRRLADFVSWMHPQYLDKHTVTDSADSHRALRTRRHIWSAKTYSQRKRRIDEGLHSYLFFFGTLLDDETLHTQLLADQGDCFLITAPRSADYEKYGTHRKWLLVFLANDHVIIKAQVTFLSKHFVMLKDRKVRLEEFIRSQNLRPIERPTVFDSFQIQPKLPIIPALSFPIAPEIFPLGLLSQKTACFDSKRGLPVMCMNINTENEDVINHIRNETERMLIFGNERIWRLWGICSPCSTECTLVLEDIVYGSLAAYVRKHWDKDQLLRFSLQTCDALRYLEKMNFVHHQLDLDCLMLTYDHNIKLAIYGLLPDELLPLETGCHSLDKIRWSPWECLPEPISTPTGQGNLAGEQYSFTGMVYTFGSMVWSMCHGGMLPFENEKPENIKSKAFRMENSLEIEENLTPNKLESVITKCWSRKPSHRPSFKDLKHQLRHAMQKTIQ